MHQYPERDGEEDRWKDSKVKGGGRNGQDKVENWYPKPFRQPQTTGKSRGEVKFETDLPFPRHQWSACIHRDWELAAGSVQCNTLDPVDNARD